MNGLVFCCLVISSAFVQSVDAPAMGRTFLLTPPPHGSGPVPVEVGFHVIDFGRITAREESFEATVYLELRWQDPRLADALADGRWVPTQKIWMPRVSFDNAADAPHSHGEPVIEVDPSGLVVFETILSCRFSVPLDLRAFPFDSQVLPIRVSLYDDETLVQFRLMSNRSRIHEDAFVTDWVLGEPSIRVESREFSHGEDRFSSLLHEVQIHRRSTFFLWRILLPLTLLPIVSFVIFWVEPSNLQPQISTCMATLIALVTFHFAVDFALPKVTYLTLVDRQALIGFITVAIEVFFVGWVHSVVRTGNLLKADRVMRLGRYGFPLIYLAVILLNLAPAFVAAGLL